MTREQDAYTAYNAARERALLAYDAWMDDHNAETDAAWEAANAAADAAFAAWFELWQADIDAHVKKEA